MNYAENEAMVFGMLLGGICTDQGERDDFNRERAALRCYNCAWHSDMDEQVVERRREKQVAADDWVLTDEIYLACPWCEEELDES